MEETVREVEAVPLALPEHEKLAKIKDFSQTCGEFIDWLSDKKSITLAEWGKDTEMHMSRSLYVCHTPLEHLLAEFFGIDRKKLEQEKLAMLEALRRGEAV